MLREMFTGDSWLELGEGASVTFKHASSGREFTLSGPGVARPCRNGAEQIAIGSGRFRATAGAGARPGAEVLVFTPFGALRYGDAELKLEVLARHASVRVVSGEAWVEREPAAQATKVTPSGRPMKLSSKPNAAHLERMCELLSQQAATLGGSLVGSVPSARASLSERAVEHMKSRRAARVACGIAEAYASLLQGDERGRLLDRISELDQASRTLPAPGEAPHP